MWKWIKCVLGLCDHKFQFWTNVMHHGQPCHVYGCEKCFRKRYVSWGDASPNL